MREQNGHTAGEFPLFALTHVLDLLGDVLDVESAILSPIRRITTMLIANDNNDPFSIGRGPDIDSKEFILVRIDQPLKLSVPLPPT